MKFQPLRAPNLLFAAGLLITGAGIWLLLPAQLEDAGWQNASTEIPTIDAGPKEGPNYLGWATLLLGFLTLASSHYFKLREARRADREEAREIHDSRRRADDLH